jgi:hypothetical protein
MFSIIKSRQMNFDTLNEQEVSLPLKKVVIIRNLDTSQEVDDMPESDFSIEDVEKDIPDDIDNYSMDELDDWDIDLDSDEELDADELDNAELDTDELDTEDLPEIDDDEDDDTVDADELDDEDIDEGFSPSFDDNDF